MVQFIKAYNEGESTVFEYSCIGVSERVAKSKCLTSLLARMPAQASGVENVSAHKMGGGTISEYRVEITITPSKDIKHRIGLSGVVSRIEELL